MANWYVNSVDQTQVVGSTVASQQVDLTITNVDSNGVHSGYNLSATNFKIGGATESPTNTWTGGNVDTEVAKVVFSDNGIAGDPANTVNAKVFLNSFTCPTAAETIFVDIDESATPPAPAKRSVCVHSYYTADTNSSVTVTDLTDITETSVQAGATGGPPGIYKHSGTVNDNVSTKIAKLTFSASSGYHYVPQQIYMLNVNSYGYDYSNNYTVNTGYSYTNGNITGIIAEVYYTPPQNSPLNPDPKSDMCDLNHLFIIDFKVYQTTSAAGPTTNGIEKVEFTPEYPGGVQEAVIKVLGAPDSQYTIRVTQHAVDTASIIKYFNFTTGAFQSGSAVSGTQTINSEGFLNHAITLPLREDSGVSTMEYHIVIAAVGTTVLQSTVPDALSEAVITHLGQNTLDIDVQDANFFSDVETVTIKHPTKSQASGATMSTPIGRSVTKKGGNGNTSSTTLTLDENPVGVESGMLVLGLGGGTHGATVTNIQNKTITLSKAIKIPNRSNIKFEKQTASLKEFEFICPALTKGNTTLSIDFTDTSEDGTENSGGRQPKPKDIGGFESLSAKVNGATSSSTSLRLDAGTTRGIVPGMAVTGTGISGTVTVATVVDDILHRDITLSSAQTIADDTVLFFESQVPSVQVVDIQAAKEDGNIVVRGFLRVTDLGDKTVPESFARLYVNDFIKIVKTV